MPYVTVDHQRVFYQSLLDDVAKRHPPLVLVHGAGGTRLYWQPQLRHLEGFDTIVFDLPGHGRSEGDGCSRIEAYREAVYEATKTLGLRPFVLCGHSMGGAIALDFALSHPERLDGLVLINTGARLQVAEEILNGISHDFTGTLRLIADRAYGSAPSEKMRHLYVERMREVHPRIILDDFHACNNFNVVDKIGTIQHPTLLLCGRNDHLTHPRFSHYLHEHLPRATLVEYELGGHMLMLEYPESVAGAVIDFVIGVQQGAVARQATPASRTPV